MHNRSVATQFFPLRNRPWLVRCSGVPLLPLLTALLLCLAAPVSGQSARAATKKDVQKDVQTPRPRTEDGFSFLGVGKAAHIDPTRKSVFEDYTLRPDRSCTGCWCNHAFGSRLNESLFDLNEKSPEFQQAWKRIQPCLNEKYNAVPQVRSLLLQPKYSDTAYAQATLFFSEFLDRPLAFILAARDPDKTLEELTQRFGPPLSVEDTWYLWQSDGDLMILDLFDKKYKKSDSGTLYVYFLSALDSHIARVRQAAGTKTHQQEKTKE